MRRGDIQTNDKAGGFIEAEGVDILQISIPFIEYWAANSAAVQRGRELHTAFSLLCRSSDSTLVWADYPGSGGKVYLVGVDLRNPDTPRFRCSCPSRQNPCKHTLGLLWALMLDGERFSEAEVPRELFAPAKKPVRTTGTSDVKLYSLQSEGLSLPREILSELFRHGLGGASRPILTEWKTLAREMYDYALPGLGQQFLELLNCAWGGLSEGLFPKFCALHRVVCQAQEYIRLRIENPGTPLHSELETFMGRKWRLGELVSLGYTKQRVSLFQLHFHIGDNPEAKQFNDQGIWADTSDGEIYITQNLRPYAASRHLQPGDSCSSLLETEQLCIYPGSSRVRWSACLLHDAPENIGEILCEKALPGLNEAISRAVQVLLKTPGNLPTYLVRFSAIGESGGWVYLQDAQGGSFPLCKSGEPVAEIISGIYHQGCEACVLRFRLGNQAGGLVAEPLCLISHIGVYATVCPGIGLLHTDKMPERPSTELDALKKLTRRAYMRSDDPEGLLKSGYDALECLLMNTTPHAFPGDFAKLAFQIPPDKADITYSRRQNIIDMLTGAKRPDGLCHAIEDKTALAPELLPFWLDALEKKTLSRVAVEALAQIGSRVMPAACARHNGDDSSDQRTLLCVLLLCCREQDFEHWLCEAEKILVQWDIKVLNAVVSALQRRLQLYPGGKSKSGKALYCFFTKLLPMLISRPGSHILLVQACLDAIGSFGTAESEVFLEEMLRFAEHKAMKEMCL